MFSKKNTIYNTIHSNLLNTGTYHTKMTQTFEGGCRHCGQLQPVEERRSELQEWPRHLRAILKQDAQTSINQPNLNQSSRINLTPWHLGAVLKPVPVFTKSHSILEGFLNPYRY